MQFAVGFKIQGKTGHVVVDAEDALIAALKVKMQRPEALIAYVRQQNKRGDTRHPMRRLGNESRLVEGRTPGRPRIRLNNPATGTLEACMLPLTIFSQSSLGCTVSSRLWR